MAGESDIQKLELRIKELEDQLKAMRSAQGAQLSAEDLQAFQRVRDTLLCSVSGCLNECSRCIANCAWRCIFECTCGPCGGCGGCGGCIVERPMSGGAGRFGGLGG